MFLAVVIDLFSRRVVDWSMREDLHRSLVIDALEMGWFQRRPGKGELIFHSDRGSQYASQDYREVLDRYGIRTSMSRRGNCWDNAVTETLFGSLKVERLHGERFLTLRQAKDAVLAWLLWYNQQRMHSTLNYVSPAQYEQQWSQTQLAGGTEGLAESMEETMKPFLPPFPQTMEIACGDSHTSATTTTTGL